MIYAQAWKCHFRITEGVLIRRKQFVSSVGALLVFFACTIFFSFSACAQNTADKEIRQAIKTHLNNELRQIAHQQKWKKYSHQWKIWLPDSARHLPVCRTKLKITNRSSQRWPVGRLKRQVQCTNTQSPWKINVTIKASVTLPVVVMSQAVNRGKQMQASMLKLEKRKLTRESNFLTQVIQAEGKTTSRRLRAGQILNPLWLEKKPLVLKGNQVLIIAAKGPFRASTKGVALETGGKGEQIKVQNSQSKKIIQAIVTGKNEVHTQF